jgi:hypothetical protein
MAASDFNGPRRLYIHPAVLERLRRVRKRLSGNQMGNRLITPCPCGTDECKNQAPFDESLSDLDFVIGYLSAAFEPDTPQEPS